MRTVVGLVVALAFGASSAVAAVPAPDQVSGSGTTSVGSTFSFFVADPIASENPGESFSLTGGQPGAPNWEATPRCLNAAGDRATLGWLIQSGSSGDGTDLSGRGVVLWVQYHDEHGTLYYRVLDRDEAITCPDPRPGPDSSLSPIEFFGNTSVFDEQPRIPPGSDSVSGSARACASRNIDQICIDDVDISLDVASGSTGQNPTGAVYVTYAGTTPGSTSRVRAAVTCLTVTDQVAIVGVTGSRQRGGSSSPHTQLAGLIRIVDGGGPDTGADRFDFALDEGPRDGAPLPGPSNCSSFPGPSPAIPAFTNEKGNVVVTDSPPPTAYAQCRKAGWVRYGFDSHAACNGYVHDLARRKCIFERAAHGIDAFRTKYGLGPSQDHAMRHCVRLYTGW